MLENKNIRSFLNYLEGEKNYTPHTLRAYKDDLGFFYSYLQEHHDKMPLEEVAYTQIRSWIVSLSEEGKTNRTINRKLSSLSAFYKFLMKTMTIPKNPMAMHKSLKTPKRVSLPFSQEEIDAVLSFLEDDKTYTGIRDRLMVELFYCTGIRRSELIGLKISDGDFDRCTVKVLGKGNKVRYVPMIPTLIHSTKRYLTILHQTFEGLTGYSSLFLTKKGVKVNQSLVYRIINSYFRKVSTKIKCSPHVLRHTFATHLLGQGADLNALKELLGHSTLSSTEVYLSSDMSLLKQAYSTSHPRKNKSN